ncbi:MAG: right-handed parallel beta-helix repeat-containing protein [Elusimicrobia bacterium]|nr:right-handed parallel beta-helix repeat-containing protein [Elusimicrobiota bacterium]
MNRRFLFFLGLAGWAGATARSATYYVEAARGNDAWAGTVANGGFLPSGCESDGNTSDCANGPWKTLARANAAPLNPGDSVLLKRGEVWREPLVVGRSGNASSPITFGAYGSGSLPRIIASTRVTGWTLASGNIYWAAVPGEVNQVLVDDDALEEAYEPNGDFFYADATHATDPNQRIIDNDMAISAGVLTGARVIMKTLPWAYETKVVQSYAAGSHTLTLDSPTSDPITTGVGYRLIGKIDFLNRAGEWVYDSSAGRLYVWLKDSASPAGHRVEMNGTAVGIEIEGRNYITVQDLAVEGASDSGIHVKYSASGNATVHTEIKRVALTSCWIGVRVEGGNLKVENFVLQDSLIQKCAKAGLSLIYVNGGTITGNRVEDTGQNTSGSYQIGIEMINLQNGVVSGNTVLRSGWCGISAVGDNLTIDSNRIEDSCLFSTDCGAIYTGSAKDVRDHPYHATPPGIRISHNFIRRCPGYWAGSTVDHSQAEGIYLDNESTQYTVENNAILDVGDCGIQLHDAYNNVVRNNVVFGGRRGALRFIEDDNLVYGDGGAAGFATNNSVHDNLLLNDVSAENPTVMIFGFLGSLRVGALDHNVYGQLYTDQFASSYIPDGLTGGPPSVYYSLSKWRSELMQDAHSLWLGDWYQAEKYRNTAVLGPSLISNGTFNAGISSWSRYPGSAVIDWDSSAGGVQPGSLRMTYDTATDGAMTNSGSFSLIAGVTYELKYTARALSNTTLTPTLRLAADPYTVHAQFRTVAAPSWKTFAFHFTPSVNLPNTRLDFESPGGMATAYWLDDVQLVPVTAVLNDPLKAMRVLANDTDTPQSFPLSGRAADVSGTIVDSAVLLPPWTIKPLLFPYDNADGACNNRETHATAPGDCAVGEQGPDVDDRVPPGPPSSLKATVHSSTQISLVWGAAVDDRIVRGYRVSRNGALLGEAAGLSFADSGLTPGKVYFYSVAAVDEGNNLSEPATLVAATWPTDADPAVLKSTRKVVTPGAGASTDGAVFGANARRLEVFTARGDKVFESSSDGAAPLHWEGQDGGGAPVVSGAYLVVVTDAQGRQEFQVIAVEH